LKKLIIFINVSYFSIIKILKEHTDSELITRWTNGDKHAFELLYKKHSVQLLQIALIKSGNRENAEELVQETFISLFQQKGKIEASTSIPAYLYVILKHKLINFYRKELVRQKYADYITARNESVSLSPHFHLETKELEEKLKSEIEKLPPQCRMVFKLSREGGLSDKEIAAEMNISVNTVEQHKRKALRDLRTSLSQFFELGIIIYLLK
jgi:RNA polymerase sigma-70 factor (family 1)